MVAQLSKESTLLTHELQLGGSLNHSVHNERRADFSLMLAMLVSDAREYSQFKLPKTVDEVVEKDDAYLRRYFNLPNQQALSLTEHASLLAYHQAELIERNLLASLKLTDSLVPKPLAFRDDKTHIPTPVKENTSLYCQQVLTHNEQKVNRLSMKANEWLRNVQDTIVQSSLVTA